MTALRDHSLAKAGAVALVTVLSSVHAMALTQSFTSTLAPTLTNLPTNTPLSFPKFDTSKGTLESVSVMLAGQGTTQITFTAPNSESNFGIGTSVSLWAQDATGQLTNDGPAASLGNPQLFLSKGTTYATVAQGQAYTTPVLSFTAVSNTQVYTAASILNLFKATPQDSDFELLLNTLTQTTLTYTGGNVTSSQTTYVSGSGTVTYTYSSVPEATTLLLGFAAGCPIIMHRRRRVA